MRKNHSKTIIPISITLMMLFVLGGCQQKEDPQATLEVTNLKKGVYCMGLLENKKDLDAVRRECFSENYIQHSPWISGGRAAVLNFFENRFKKHPDFTIEIKRTAADGDLVWVHLHTKRTPDVMGNAVINIFRMQEGKFVEHWNVV